MKFFCVFIKFINRDKEIIIYYIFNKYNKFFDYIKKKLDDYNVNEFYKK